MVISSRARSVANKAKLLLHYGRQTVAVKCDNLSILEAENIGRGDIDCLARGSDSLGANGQLTVMRSPNSMLDDHDVPRGVNARYLTADIWKGTCEGGDRVANGLSAKLRA